MRVVTWAAGVGVLIWGGLDQLYRYMGAPGGPTFDLSVSNTTTLATFGAALALIFVLASSKSRSHRFLFATTLVVMIGPLWLSTRHVYISSNSMIVERNLFLTRTFYSGDPETRCFVNRRNTILILDKNGDELGEFFSGIFPWTLSREDILKSINANCQR